MPRGKHQEYLPVKRESIHKAGSPNLLVSNMIHVSLVYMYHIRYSLLMKHVLWVGDTRGVARSFPKQVRRDIGTELRRVQEGLNPVNWKPMASIGKNVREIRVAYRGQFRLI